ncbi:hypothetical protein [Hydrogenophaga intermedia]|uniref:hypothetical protein n=1 Tax=Hydrogenophaga intermedia TaxID=65786 RepID=UPI0020435315|nr:hypothetical protein [Hydrogenophaga intermedia]MCM3562865.1 hypothetical protein [Hydrogenophaga intermedia]
MSDYSFPNKDDSFHTRVTYTVAAEFIYRLDEYLEDEHEWSSADGSVPAESLFAAMECAEAAVGMLHDLECAWTDPTVPGWGQFVINPEALSTMREDAASIVNGAAEAVNGIAQALAPAPTSASPKKARLLAVLGNEFFARFHALCDWVIGDAQSNVESWKVQMVRGCIDAAMGMLHELKEATWAEGGEVPARAIIPLHDHVISDRLEYAGTAAVRLMGEVYQAVAEAVMQEP